VVYVDNDPIVLAHARALMDSTPEGRTSYVHASVTEPRTILAAPELTSTLDLSRPVALSALALLHFVPDELDAYGVMAQLVDALPSGSALILSHGTADFDPEVMAAVARVYESGGTKAQARGKEEFRRFFDGLRLIEPGIEVPHRWRPDAGGGHVGGAEEAADDAAVALWAGVAVKP
jgi:hypothetical protein